LPRPTHLPQLACSPDKPVGSILDLPGILPRGKSNSKASRTCTSSLTLSWKASITPTAPTSACISDSLHTATSTLGVKEEKKAHLVAVFFTC
jgi:hypothetical protein